jgi:hypothetical protein
MRPIGFSTGALALGDFKKALGMLRGFETKAVELSALRDHEVDGLMAALPILNLQMFDYVSVHVPSAFRVLSEDEVAARLSPCLRLKIPVVLHPDAIRNVSLWRQFGSLLCIENMDKRKRTGRTADELEGFFSSLPDATFCFDIGHARQIDSTMGEARRILKRFGNRLRQIHFSEIDAEGHHHGATLVTQLASRKIASLISEDVPIIIESQISPDQIEKELVCAEGALRHQTVELTTTDFGALA